MTQKSFTAIKCKINYLQLSNSREYFFSTYFRIQPDVTYHDLVVFHLIGNMCTKFQVNWTSTSSKTTSTKHFNQNFNPKQDKQTDKQTNKQIGTLEKRGKHKRIHKNTCKNH